MPLPERLIQPVSVSRGTLQYPVPDVLEGVTNGSLANIIRQLSSLSRHAEEMFGNLFKEAEDVATRSSNLQARIDRLAVQVTQLDSTVEVVSLQDIRLKQAFRSSQSFDQQVVSRDTMPKAMLEAYLACDKPPPLDKLNPFREDGKDGLKFYTDPNYFFELWKQEMLKDTERMMHDRGKKYFSLMQDEMTEDLESLVKFQTGKAGNHVTNGNGNAQKGDRNKKRIRQPHNTTEKQRQKALGQGEYIMQQDYDHHHQGYMNNHVNEANTSKTSGIIGYDPALSSPPPDTRNQVRPNSIDVKRPYQGYQYNANNEDIYMPRILRSEQPSSPQHQQSQPLQMPQYHPPTSMQEPDLNTIRYVDAYGGGAPSYDLQTGGSAAGTPTRRPNQPPPAPPPGQYPESPTRQLRAGSSQRDSLPPPPPPPDNELPQLQPVPNLLANTPPQQSPMQQLLNQLNSHHLTKQGSPSHDRSANDSDLPPPPPVPANNSLLNARVPPEHLPPSPPPPPEPVTSSASYVTNGVATNSAPQPPPAGAQPPPPPPPPPPSGGITNGFKNGDVHNQANNIKSGSPLKNQSSPEKNSILSPPGLKKPAPKNMPVQDGIRSDLLKAIRDGIALRKVENKRDEAKDGEKESGAQADVASILARRVAVEMSDSDDAEGAGGPTDSEYDSDDWGDESTA